MAEAYENEEENINTDDNAALGFEIVSWETPEYHKHERTHWWYWIFGAVGICLLIYSIFTSDYLFAIIIILGGLVLIVSDARHPELISITITTEGIIVGPKFYDYDQMHHFAVIYKPVGNLKRVYIEFKSSLRHRLSLPLHDVNPIFVRENLMKYLPEDLERIDEPLSEFIGRLLRL